MGNEGIPSSHSSVQHIACNFLLRSHVRYVWQKNDCRGSQEFKGWHLTLHVYNYCVVGRLLFDWYDSRTGASVLSQCPVKNDALILYVRLWRKGSVGEVEGEVWKEQSCDVSTWRSSEGSSTTYLFMTFCPSPSLWGRGFPSYLCSPSCPTYWLHALQGM